jgi:hypothetical protein
MASSMQGFTSLSINLDKSKTDLETAKGTNKICAVKTRQQVSDENIWTPWNGGYSTPELQKCLTPARYSTKKSKADSISNQRAILPLGSLKLNSQINA